MRFPRRTLQGLGRCALRTWGRAGTAPGYLYQAVERFGARLAAGERLPSQLPNGCRIECNLTDQVERLMYFLGVYEPVESWLFTCLLSPGMVVVDAGANVGQYTLLASTGVGETGQVHAFEPVPDTFTRLSSHIECNHLTNVSTARAALWNCEDTLHLSLETERTDNAGAWSAGVQNSNFVVDSPAYRLDDYLAARGVEHIDLVKMDIEGAELFALQGMERLIEKCRPLMFVEVCRHTSNRLGYDTVELWNLLHGRYGYRAWLIGHSPATCRPLDSLNGIEQQNVLFHMGDLEPNVTSGWTLQSCLRWAATPQFKTTGVAQFSQHDPAARKCDD